MDVDEFNYRLERAKRRRAHAHWLMRWDRRDPLPEDLLNRGIKSITVEAAKIALREAIVELKKAKEARTQ